MSRRDRPPSRQGSPPPPSAKGATAAAAGGAAATGAPPPMPRAPPNGDAGMMMVRAVRPPGPIRWRCTLHNVIYEVLQSRAGWIDTESDTEWDFFWAERAWLAERGGELPRGGQGPGSRPWQRINHFPNHQQLTRKDLLARNLRRAAREAALAQALAAEEAASRAAGPWGAARQPGATARARRQRWQQQAADGGGGAAAAAAGAAAGPFDFLPPTFLLPTEYRLFADAFRRCGGTWIMKPIGRCQGQGISLVSRAAQVGLWAPQQQQQQAPEGPPPRPAAAAAAADVVADDDDDDDDDCVDFDAATPAAASHSSGDDDDGGDNNNNNDDPTVARRRRRSPRPPAAAAAAPDALRARYGAAYCAQRYVESPYLIAGRKFDLRIYALVTAHHVSGCASGSGLGLGASSSSSSSNVAAPPHLRVYLHRSGFARFAGSRYSMRKGDLADARVHLTNVAVQKQQQQPRPAAGAAANGSSGNDDGGGDNPVVAPRPPSLAAAAPDPPPPALKWSLRELRLHLAQRHGRPAADALFSAIQSLVVRVLLAVRGQVRADRRCFELYGYDVLVDSALRPWLLEVNASPSLTTSDAQDRALKFAMLHDALDAVGVERAAAAFGAAGPRAGAGGAAGAAAAAVPSCSPPPPPRRVGGFDLVWDGGPVGGAGGGPGGGGGGGGTRGAGASASASSAALSSSSCLSPSFQAGHNNTLGPASMLGCYNERDEGMWRWSSRAEDEEEGRA